MERPLSIDMEGGTRLTKRDESYMIKDYIRRIAIKDFVGMKKSVIQDVDRIGIGKHTYFKYWMYRTIKTQDKNINGVSIQLARGRFAFNPERYINLLEGANSRYLGKRLHHLVKNRSVSDRRSYEFQYGNKRGMFPVDVDRNDYTGEFSVRFNEEIR